MSSRSISGARNSAMARPPLPGPIPGKDIIAQLHKKHGRKLFANPYDRLVPPGEGTRPTLRRKLANAVLLRIATRSLPGALMVGTGLIARHLHTLHMARKAKDAGDVVVDVTPRESAKPPHR